MRTKEGWRKWGPSYADVGRRVSQAGGATRAVALRCPVRKAALRPQWLEQGHEGKSKLRAESERKPSQITLALWPLQGLKGFCESK